jgi:hypothetical protein
MYVAVEKEPRNVTYRARACTFDFGPTSWPVLAVLHFVLVRTHADSFSVMLSVYLTVRRL